MQNAIYLVFSEAAVWLVVYNFTRNKFRFGFVTINKGPYSSTTNLYVEIRFI